MHKKKPTAGYSFSFFKNTIARLIAHPMDFILAGFFLLCFYPLANVWFYGDDAVSRDIYAFMQYENKSFLEFLKSQMEYYILTVGRFYPVHIWQRFLTFYFFNSISAYRLFLLLMNFVAIYSFAKMVKVFSGSKKMFYAVLLLFPGAFLFLTRYDDAITSYYMFIQMLVFYLSVSLILLKQYLESGRKRFLWLSVLLYLFSLLTYESSYFLVLVYPLAVFYSLEMPFRERMKKALLHSAPYFVTAFFCFGAYVAFSTRAVGEYQGIQFHFDPVKIAVTFLKQVIASFPVVPHAYLLFNKEGIFHFNLKQAFSNVTALDLITSIAYVYLIMQIFRRKEDKPEANTIRFLCWLSVMLVVFPSLIISFSYKYQQGLIWGLGYLTIYLSRFGLLVLGYLLYTTIIEKCRTRTVRYAIQGIGILLLLFVHLFSLQGNRDVVTHKNQSSYIRHIAEQSIEAGLLRDIPENSILLLGNIWYDYPSFTRNSIFSSWLDTRVSTDTIRSFIKTSYENTGEMRTYQYHNHDVYYLHFYKYPSNSGYAFSGKLETLAMDEANITGLLARDFMFFYTGEEVHAIDILVQDGAGFELERHPLVPIGDKAYVAVVSGLVDLQSVELVTMASPSIWQMR